MSVGAGNACAWLLLEFLKWKYSYVPEDPVTTAIMAGTLFSLGALQVRRVGASMKYVFDRFFPPKEGNDT